MSGYCIDHDKHFLDTCPSCQPKSEKGKECDGPGYPNQHTSPAVWCTCKDYAPAKLEWEERFERWLGDEFDKPRKTTPGETHRWLFCWDGEDPAGTAFDCACCLTDPSSEFFNNGCGCICHQRIGQLKSFISQLLLSSRQSAIESCVKAVEKRKDDGCLSIHEHPKDCNLWCRNMDAAITALRRLLREESEDKT